MSTRRLRSSDCCHNSVFAMSFKYRPTDLIAYPQHACDSPARSCKHHSNITRYRRWRRYVITWPSCFHQRLKAAISYNLEGPSTFRNPADDFGSKTGKLGRVLLYLSIVDDKLRLHLCMLPVREGDLAFSIPFKHCCDRSIWMP